MADGGQSRSAKQARINRVQDDPAATVDTIRNRSSNIDKTLDAMESGTARQPDAQVTNTSPGFSGGRSALDQIKRFFGSDDK